MTASTPAASTATAEYNDTHEGRCKMIRDFGGPALARAVQLGHISVKDAAKCSAYAASQPVAAAPVTTGTAIAMSLSPSIGDVLAEKDRQIADLRAALQQRQAPALQIESLTRYSQWSNGSACGMDPSPNGRWVELDDLIAKQAEQRQAPAVLSKLPRYYMGATEMRPHPSGKYFKVADVEALLTRQAEAAPVASAEPAAWANLRDLESDQHIDCWAYKTPNYTEPLYRKSAFLKSAELVDCGTCGCQVTVPVDHYIAAPVAQADPAPADDKQMLNAVLLGLVEQSERDSVLEEAARVCEKPHDADIFTQNKLAAAIRALKSRAAPAPTAEPVAWADESQSKLYWAKGHPIATKAGKVALTYLASPPPHPVSIEAGGAEALEKAAQLAIKFTAVPRDCLGPATVQMKTLANVGEKIAAAIRDLRAAHPSPEGGAAEANLDKIRIRQAFLNWNREQDDMPVEVGREYFVVEKVLELAATSSTQQETDNG